MCILPILPHQMSYSVGEKPFQRLAPSLAQVALPPRAGEPSSSPYASALRVFRPASFATVVDTFGLCSHDDPVATLRVRTSSPS